MLAELLLIIAAFPTLHLPSLLLLLLLWLRLLLQFLLLPLLQVRRKDTQTKTYRQPTSWPWNYPSKVKSMASSKQFLYPGNSSKSLRFLDLYYSNLHLDCYHFCQQCKDLSTKTNRPNQIPFVALFFCRAMFEQ